MPTLKRGPLVPSEGGACSVILLMASKPLLTRCARIGVESPIVGLAVRSRVGIRSPAKNQLNLVCARALCGWELPQHHAVLDTRFDFVRAVARPVVLCYRHLGHRAILLNDESHDDLAGQCRVRMEPELRIAVLK